MLTNVETTMSPLLQQDFTKIVAGNQPLPDGDYLVQIEKIEAGGGAEDVDPANRDKKPFLNFQLEVMEGEYQGRMLFDNLVLVTNKGEINKISLGRVKEYAEAVLGKEAANNPSGLNTDDLVKGTCRVSVKIENYDYEKVKGDPSTRKTGTSNKIARVLAV